MRIRLAAKTLTLAIIAACAVTVNCGDSGAAPGESLAVLPPAVELEPQAVERFSASIGASAAQGVLWTVQEGTTGGSITTGGLYTAPASTGIFHVVATSLTNASMQALATVTVTASQSVAVAVTPAAVTVPVLGIEQFTATVTGSEDGNVTWSLREGTRCGDVSATGLYTAPASAAVCHVDATSTADPTQTGSSTVTVSDGSGTIVAAGAITTQTWSAAGSPYRIMGDVYIPRNNRLTIQPGVQVRFQGHYRMEGPGVIDARGTAYTQRDILFTAEDPTAGWYGIRIWDGNDDGTAPDVSDYHLENCIIEYVNKDRSNPRAFGDANYNDSRGALYVYGATAYDPSCPNSYCGLKQSDLHLNGLVLRHNKATSTDSPVGGGAGMYFNTLDDSIHPVWTNVVFEDNHSASYGAAFTQHHAGPLTFQNCTMTQGVSDDTSTNGSGTVGYWDVSGPVTLDTCYLDSNTPNTFATSGSPDVVVLNALTSPP